MNSGCQSGHGVTESAGLIQISRRSWPIARSTCPPHGAHTPPLAPRRRAKVEETSDVLRLLPFLIPLTALFSTPHRSDRARHCHHHAPPAHAPSLLHHRLIQLTSSSAVVTFSTPTC